MPSMRVQRRAGGPPLFCWPNGQLETLMRNAQKAALMAMFAAMEEQTEADRDAANAPATPFTPEPKTARPILVDLAALAQRHLKKVA